MGKASKGSRKGKKAWRANIKTDDIEEFYEQQTRDAHAGAAAIASLPSDSLFFVDKPTTSASTSTADTITKGQFRPHTPPLTFHKTSSVLTRHWPPKLPKLLTASILYLTYTVHDKN